MSNISAFSSLDNNHLGTAKACYLGKVFKFYENRNARCGSYCYPGRYYLSVDGIIESIENRRTKGSSWNIYEIPAIVIIGSHKKSLFISQKSRINYIDIPINTRNNESIYDIGRFYDDNFSDKLDILIVDDELPEIAKYPIMTHESNRRGEWTVEKSYLCDIGKMIEGVKFINMALSNF